MKNTIIIIIAIIVLVIAFLAFTGVPYLSKGYGKAKEGLGTVAGPVLKGIGAAAGSVTGVVDSYINLIHTKKENEQLRKKLESLQLENQKMNEYDRENKRLRVLLQFMQQNPRAYIAASVIGEDLKNWYKCIIIDKGKNHGLKQKMPVVTANGLVGQIVEVAHMHSKVMIINDTNSSVDVVVDGKSTRGILDGKSQMVLKLKYVRKADQIEVGDKLVTSGKDGIFPKGIAVGIVTQVSNRHPGIFSEIEVMPHNNYKNLNEVLIVKRQ